ncbi:MAG TPA: TIGR03986 family CRISPR-associated RAMP protein [Kineosporiaceae bacterium]
MVPQYFRAEERTATKQGDVITATASHSINPKAAAKPQRYARRFWDDDVAAWFAQASDGDEVAVVVQVTANSEGYLSLKNRPVLAAVPTPAGLRAALEEAGGFVNPYTFVPALPRAGLTGGPGETGLGDSGPGGPPDHSLLGKDEWVGRLRVRLTTLTPLLLPDTERARTDGDGRLTFDTRRDTDGAPLIPGSSLKGALRSAYETVTASRFGVLGQHDRRLAYRIPATKGIDVVPAVVEAGEDGRKVFRLCRGDPAWTAPSQPKNAVQAAAWVPAYRGQERHLHLVGGLRGDLSSLHEKEVAARLRLYQYERPGRSGRFRVWRVTHLAPTLAALESSLATAPPQDPGSPSRSLCLVENVPPRTAVGRLSVTRHSIENKHDERFFVLTGGDQRVPVDDAHREFWQSVLDAYLDAKDYNTVPQGLHRSRHVDEAARLRGLPIGTVAYVELDSASQAVTGVHPVMIGRMPFDRTPRSLLDRSLRAATTAAELSPADRLFGWVASSTASTASTASTGTAGNGRRRASGYRGRLAVRAITCAQDDWRADLPEGGVVLAAMSSPKPTQFRFYAARDQQGSPVPPKVPKKSGYTSGAGLRGRKMYRWPVASPAYWQPSGATQDYSTLNGPLDGPQRYREYLDPGAPASQTVRYSSWVRPGVTFEAELFLDGVPTAELGALVWLLNQGEKAPLRLGAGKPLGFGVLACTIDWDGTELRDGAAVAQGWRQLSPPPAADTGAVRSLATQFEATATAHPVLAEALASYRSATAGVTDHPVHYPRPVERPQPESYTWFVENDRVTRDGVTRGWALPHVRDQVQQLPYVTPDPGPGRDQGRGAGRAGNDRDRTQGNRNGQGRQPQGRGGPRPGDGQRRPR